LSFFKELKRRNVIRVAIAYLAGAWLLIEVAGTLFPAFGVPDWGVRFVVIVLALGFLSALIISWVYELTPEGLKREKDVVRDVSITQLTAKRLDWVTIGLIAAALVFIAADRFWMSPRHPEQPAAPVEVVTDHEQASEPEPQYPPNSIAVLPFVNMSSDPEQEYFSDGLSEELLNLLTRIPELRVVARTSSFSFKGQNLEIPEIARRLKVAHVLEGSVRKAGNRVRITAQLIKANDGYHLWSESYDRTLNDIFAIQDEIAAEVVAQLKVELLGDVPIVKKINPQAFALYLQARHLGSQHTAEAFEQSNRLYQQALAIDPNYATAWAGLARNYHLQAGIGLLPNNEGNLQARAAAQQALAIDPEHALAHAYLGRIAAMYDQDLESAARHLERALALEPANPDILNRGAALARDLSRLDEAIAMGKHSVNRDPVNPQSHSVLGKCYLWAGRLDEAIASLRTTLTLSPTFINAHYRIGVALLLKGEPEAALAEMQQERQAKRLEGEAIVNHALGRQTESDASLAGLIDTFTAYNIAYVLAFRDEADLAFEWLDKAVQHNDNGLTQIVNQPEFASIHNDPRWLPFLESIGKSPKQLAAIKFKVTLPE
jgi:TolB-like protein/Tfp pilus assembly protein PilF